jgi:hypothetical protein
MRIMKGRGRPLMTAAVVAISGLGLAGGVAGTAQAALPDAWGFALVQTPSGAAVAGHWAESVPSPPPTASPGSPGQEIVRFPGIGIKGGAVHATAVTDQFAWCQAQKWGPSGSTETVVVQCYLKGGAPGFVPFTVTFSASSGAVAGAGLLYAYVHDTNAAVAASYNSAGGVNTVTTLSPGEWLVRLPGPGPAAQTGGLQVTAAHPAKPAICDVASWTWTPSEQDIRGALLRRARRAAAVGLVADLPERAGDHRRRAQAARLHAEQPAAGSRAVRAGAAGGQLQFGGRR